MDARVQVYSDKMQKAYEFLEADFAAIRAGRANPHVLDKLRVDYYGTPTPIQQVHCPNDGFAGLDDTPDICQ